MSLLESGENYLESIYRLSMIKDGVHAIDIVNDLGFSKPSVSIALKKLKEILEEWGYEQVPTCSTIETPFNPGQTVHYCRDHIQESSLRGIMTAPWVFTTPTWYYRILSDAWIFGQGKKQFYPEET